MVHKRVQARKDVLLKRGGSVDRGKEEKSECVWNAIEDSV